MTNPFMTQAQGQPAAPAASPNNPFAAQQMPPAVQEPTRENPHAPQTATPAWLPEQSAQVPGARPGYDPMAAQQMQTAPAAPQAFANNPYATQAGVPTVYGGQPMSQQQIAQAAQQMQAPAPAAPPWADRPQAGQPNAFGAPGFGADPFSTPSAGTAGPRPAIRDLVGRLVLIKVTERNAMRDKYQAKPDDAKESANICDVAVLDGGPVIMSPKMNDPQGVPTEFGPAPCVINGMIIQQKGLMNRTKAPMTLGRIVQAPMPDLKKRQDWPAVPEGTPDHQVLAWWLQQDPSRVYQFKNMMFWSIEAFTEDDAKQARTWLASNPTFNS